jgi:CRISPR/Cas system-associated exonuclease Cas4 (RecB family)
MISGWIDGGFPVARTKPLLASKLAIALECPLRYLLETEKLDIFPLPISIGGLLGSAVHKVCSLAVKEAGEAPTPASVRSLVAEEFTKMIVSNPNAMLILEALKVPLAPENLLPQAEFVARARLAYKSLQLRQSKTDFLNLPSKSLTGEAQVPRRFGPEVQLKSHRFDLIGRADWIEKLPNGAVRIVEYKTGSVRSFGEDKPKEELWIQVGAYALMAIELNSATEAVLRIVSPDNTWDRLFSAPLQEETAALLGNIEVKIPRYKTLRSEEIAAPGLGCSWCRYRHVCIPYREYAERQWRAEDARRLPLDVWGVVTELKPQTGSLIEVRVLDETSRQVRIRNVPIEAVSGEPQVGSRIRAFGLMANESGRGLKYPQNFYVADVDRPSFSAFSAMLAAS